jgi:hypothetical protein
MASALPAAWNAIDGAAIEVRLLFISLLRTSRRFAELRSMVGKRQETNQPDLEMETSMNDKTAVFVRSFPVGKHTVTMILTRRRFLAGRVTCRWSPPKPSRLTKEEKREYRSGRAAAVADAYATRKGRFGVIIER